MAQLSHHLPEILESFAPDLVLYQAGVDPHVADRLGRLSLSDEGLEARDRFVVSEARRRGLEIRGGF